MLKVTKAALPVAGLGTRCSSYASSRTCARSGPGAGGKLQLTDAIQALLKDEKVLAYRSDGVRYDCGSKLGYVKSTVEFALRHPEVEKNFEQFLTAPMPEMLATL